MTNPRCRIVSIGLDVAKKDFEAAGIVSGQDGATALAPVPFERSPGGAQALIQAIEQHAALGAEAAVRVTMEATGPYSSQLAQWLMAARPHWPVAVVNPAFIKAYGRSLGARNKTDRADAKLIARYGLERQPAGAVAMPPTLQRLRALSRERDAIVRQIVQTTNRSKEAADAPPEVRKAQKTTLKALEKQRDALEGHMLRTIAPDAHWGPIFQRLQSIPGVGKITAMVVLAEAGDLRRFNRSRQLSAFAGTHPRVVQSGASGRRRSRLSKMGCPRVRQALYLSAMAAVRDPRNPLAQTYRRLVQRGMAELAALCAVMRKQLLLMRALMIHGGSYTLAPPRAQPVHNSCA